MSIIDNKKSIQEILEESFCKYSLNKAVVCGDKDITYSDLNIRANHIAHEIKTKFNVKEGDYVGIHMPTSIDQIIAIIAILKCGAAYIPIDATYPLERKKYMLSNAKSRIVIISGNDYKLDDSLIEFDLSMFNYSNDKVDDLNISHSNEDIMYILYTSGSTGRPKGAVLRQKGVLNMLSWYSDKFDINQADSNLIYSSFAYDLTQKNIFSTLMKGGSIILYPNNIYDPDYIIKLIQENTVTVINSTPSAFYPILDCAKNIEDIVSLRYIFLGGEKINAQRLKKINKNYPKTKVVNTYGPTECSDVVCSYELTKEDIDNNLDIPLGYVIQKAEVHVLDDKFNILGVKQQGEVYLSGVCVGEGYINQKEMTDKKFLTKLPDKIIKKGISKLYRVGDIAYWDDQERLRYVGRVDDQIKLRGNRIELLEIDATIQACEGVTESSTVFINSENNQILVTYCIADNQDENLIKNKVRDKLPAFMIPTKIIFISQFPLTANAKVDKNKLIEDFKLSEK